MQNGILLVSYFTLHFSYKGIVLCSGILLCFVVALVLPDCINEVRNIAARCGIITITLRNSALFVYKSNALVRSDGILLQHFAPLLCRFIALLQHFTPLLCHFMALLQQFAPLLRHFMALLQHFAPLLRHFIALLQHFAPLLCHFIVLLQHFASLWRNKMHTIGISATVWPFLVSRAFKNGTHTGYNLPERIHKSGWLYKTSKRRYKALIIYSFR